MGKRSLAGLLISLLVCARPGPEGACGVCPGCRMRAAGTHPDVRLLEEEGAFGIDAVRYLQAGLAYRPRGGRHILLINPADRLTTEAANALLKTLEEPQGDAVFILLSAFPERLPPTVRSRCLRIPFRRLRRDEIQRGLESMGYKGAEAELAAALARGSLGRALAIAAGDEHLAVRDEMAALARRMPGLRPAEIAAAAEKMGDRASLARRLPALLTWYRDLLLWAETGRPDLLVNADRLADIREAAAHYTTRELADMLRLIDKSLRRLGAHGNPRLIAEVLLLGLSRGRRADVGKVKGV